MASYEEFMIRIYFNNKYLMYIVYSLCSGSTTRNFGEAKMLPHRIDKVSSQYFFKKGISYNWKQNHFIPYNHIIIVLEYFMDMIELPDMHNQKDNGADCIYIGCKKA